MMRRKEKPENMNLFSLKMRASNSNTGHLSGAEKIVNKHELHTYTNALLHRALHHSKGAADEITMKVEPVQLSDIQLLEALPVKTVEVANHYEGIEEVKKLLLQLGLQQAEEIIEMLSSCSSMRGAILLDVDTMKRLEPDQERGIRATYMDANRSHFQEDLTKKNHFQEALVLATKVAHAPNVIGEICISDDPDYVTGYVASKEFGYVRITKLKQKGSHLGGRIFLYRHSESGVNETIAYLEKQKIVVDLGLSKRLNEAKQQDKWRKIKSDLASLQENHLYRSFNEIQTAQEAHVKMHDREYVMLASNSYLNLCNHPGVKSYALQMGEAYGIGSGGSRLTTGTTTLHRLLEEMIAEFKETEAALVFNTGYMANVGVISSLLSEGDVIFSDELNHASIIDGCRLSKAKTVVYKHNDMNDLEEKILAHSCENGLIVSDAVFSMDGDVVNLPELMRLANQYGLFSMIDEAHSTGILGERGRGVCKHFQLTQKPDIIMGTLSKALGGEGGFVCGDKLLIEYLKNKARSFIFSTSLSPVTSASAIEALRLIMNDDTQVTKLQENIAYFNECLQAHGISARSNSAIFPIIVGSEQAALDASAKLFDHGYFISAIRYPTVAKGSARLRVSLMADHSKKELSEAAKLIKKYIGNV
ncbi:8-amino-7-oxononanoate synthase [Priestia flexa]|uniref:8-amino-7-oxononanoate synthase n=1 Tax=Priestia flexa TaxID=86664 RepID=UPI001F26C5E3|nr:8-amino-7-oxononanoate synthase [Priestia flexa]UIR32067.1 8-amino-7-oxononanoate synthase [Priestia flexa]